VLFANGKIAYSNRSIQSLAAAGELCAKRIQKRVGVSVH